MRLNKYLAKKTGVSRREADQYIATGRVQISSGAVSETAQLGRQLTDNDIIFLDGKKIEGLVDNKTIMVNKPAGYLSSRRSQGGDPTVYDLLPKKLKTLKTAGRLDKDSSGLIILSSDGDLIQQLTHPKYQKTKTYEIELNKPLEPLHQQMINDFGVDLEDGKSQLILEKFTPKRWRVIMSEGRNRQIRRTFSALGYTITKLHRTNLGPYSLSNLKSSQWIEISR